MKLFIWDYHGVLEKDNENAVLEISNRVLKEHNFSQQFTSEENFKLYGVKWYQYFEYLLPDESHETHIKLQEACFKISQKETDIVRRHIKPNNHAHEVLQKIAEKHKQIVISNTRPKSLVMYLQAVKMTEFFPDAFASNEHRRTSTNSKIEIVKDFVQNKKFDQIIVIGDSPVDIAIAQSVSAKSYLYSHPGKDFRDCKPDERINDLREVLKEI